MKLNLVFLVFSVISITTSLSCKKELPTVIPKIYGHAGSALSEERAMFPPNTLESVQYALDGLNADGVEVDVQLSKDSVLVIYHDPYLEQQTNLSGCVNDYDYSDIKSAKYFNKYHIVQLSEIIKMTVSNNKLLYLDLKPFNFCSNQIVDFEQFSRALSLALIDLSFEQRSKITVNCRNFDLLNAIEDTAVVKCFETENIELGINYCLNNGIDKLNIRLLAFNESVKIKLNDLMIPFGISGLKTLKSIDEAAVFNPDEVITDNIAGTRKYYY